MNCHTHPQRRFHYYPHFPDEEIEAQGGEVTCSVSHSTEDRRAVGLNPATPSLAHFLNPPLRSATQRTPCGDPEQTPECLPTVRIGLLFCNLGVLTALTAWAILRMK